MQGQEYPFALWYVSWSAKVEWRRLRRRHRPKPPGARVLVARLISPAARSERAGGSIQSTHERLEPTAGGAVSTVEHPGDGATGGVRHRLVLACSWRSCERVRRAQSGCETRLNESASVWWMWYLETTPAAYSLLQLGVCQWHCSSSAKRQRAAAGPEAHVRILADRSLSFWPQVLTLTSSGAQARHEGTVKHVLICPYTPPHAPESPGGCPLSSHRSDAVASLAASTSRLPPYMITVSP